MLVEETTYLLVKLQGGQLGLSIDYGGDIFPEIIPIDAFNVLHFPEDGLPLRSSNLKVTQHWQVVG